MRDSYGNHVRVAPDCNAVVMGLSGMNVVVERDVTFVAPLARSQDVKGVVELLKHQDHPSLIKPTGDGSGCASDNSFDIGLWLFTSALPLWWSNGFDRQTGIWREALDPTTADPLNIPVRARVQGRQTYSFARAGMSGWPGPWQDALQAGFSAIDRYAGSGGDYVSARFCDR